MNFQKIREMTLGQLLEYEGYQELYVSLYGTCNGASEAEAQAHWQKETDNLKRIVNDSEKLQRATTLSFATAMLDLAYHGLSIEPVSKTLAYIVPRGHNIGTKKDKVWETRALLMISAYGELELRVRSGVIKYADNPVLVYENDTFEVRNGVVVNHTPRRQSSVITDAYIRITRFDGSVEYKIFSMDEIQAYRKQSDTKDSMAWTGGVGGQPTRGMIEAKVIKHAFSTYPRLNLGKQTVLATDEIDAEAAYASALAKTVGGAPTGDYDAGPVKPEPQVKDDVPGPDFAADPPADGNTEVGMDALHANQDASDRDYDRDYDQGAKEAEDEPPQEEETPQAEEAEATEATATDDDNNSGGEILPNFTF